MTSIDWSTTISYTPHSGVTVDAALSDRSGVGFVYTPFETFWIRHDGVQWRRREGEVDWSAVFEATAFDESSETRWRHDSSGYGSGVTVREGKDRSGPARLRPTLSSRLLWGTVAAVEDGWARMEEERIGNFWIPFADIEPRRRVIFQIAEYVRRDAYGNVSISDQRIVSLAMYRGASDGQ